MKQADLKVKLILVTIFVIVLLCVIFIGSFLNKNDAGKQNVSLITNDHEKSINEEPQTNLDRYLSKIKTQAEVKEALTSAHSHLNEITGWKHYEDMNLGQWSNYMEYIFMQHALYEKMAEVVTDENIKKDLLNVSKLVRYAKDNNNLEQSLNALIFAHRIVHDLDFYVVTTGAENLREKDKFGASFAMADHKEAEEIEKWISRNVER